mmetsp:Transcript_78539/g.153644  ORF Transcript_78539/g.153644 Transcript_78539/m.153644 type:complete len:229 (+) Transcript_78539:186-872(+)
MPNARSPRSGLSEHTPALSAASSALPTIHAASASESTPHTPSVASSTKRGLLLVLASPSTPSRDAEARSMLVTSGSAVTPTEDITESPRARVMAMPTGPFHTLPSPSIRPLMRVRSSGLCVVESSVRAFPTHLPPFPRSVESSRHPKMARLSPTFARETLCPERTAKHAVDPEIRLATPGVPRSFFWASSVALTTARSTDDTESGLSPEVSLSCWRAVTTSLGKQSAR